MRILAILGLLIGSVVTASAGVTIHYTATAPSKSAIEKILTAARAYSTEQHWKVEDASSPSGTLRRPAGDSDMPLQTSITGIRISAAPMCEPVYLQFGDDLVAYDFVKTQFAGAEVHIAVIGLFERIRPLLRSLKLEDEGEYWPDHDKSALHRNLEAVEAMIKEVRLHHPTVRGPVKINDDRIVDLMQ